MNFYVSDSVLCRYQNDDGGALQDKNCTSCVFYYCPRPCEGGHYCDDVSGWGCPEDFFQRCAENYKEHVDFVRSKNFNDMEYRKNLVKYISGCQNNTDGYSCIQQKYNTFELKHLGKHDNFYTCTEAEKPCSESDDGTSSSNNQYDALKMIGIFAIGWVLSAA
uniref:Uncharacterized protein n=1 Tax=Panagrolaimus sp. PS1159 TaxID=55785 RepID=A0AC35GG73_9BILA